MSRVEIFDSTLRDGAQAEGISFSVEDKLKIVKAMDELGVAYIEAGNPGSNPKDLEFFRRVKDIQLNNAKLTAFGSTRRRNINVSDDANVKSMLEANTEAVAIFGKSWDFHVTDIIQTTLEENLKMIEETMAFFKENGKEVFFDAEHFFDGYKANPEYALQALEAAVKGGADCLVLCDTNGGAMPLEVYEITKKVCETFSVRVGIHTHNDCGMAVANSMMAVEAGATHIQGTYIGFGERCGNANLSTIIGNLQLKKGYHCIPEENLETLTSTALFVAEIANIVLYDKEPYVGRSAFTHKGGMHIDGVNKASHSFEHINPELVGNTRRFLMSEVAGRSTILKKIAKIAPEITKDSEEAKQIIDRLKELEHEGYQFEGAESTFELIIRKHLGKYKSFFELENFKIIGEKPAKDSKFSAYAMVKVNVDGNEEFTAAEGDGPVHALDIALRKALEVFYPQLKEVHLTDYKVKVLDSKDATAGKVRVLLTSSDGKNVWSTVGVSSDIIKASLIALVDSIEVKLLRDLENKMRAYM
ncbi:2-isopropylmalate synthase [Natranaerovirga pectinivora]|uniref:Citramalate synthase n=1 Tax=Natranaerovirga pectinivora TaxID=682400 RepID=A0A4R3MPX0_9FIRM|nr:citramalate synthase [Natranaerovirga pectinivora]TCT16331.1 2-isopropylmalate synthase [Natranaerovirga pectinivora]